jgi:hypothetical protein
MRESWQDESVEDLAALAIFQSLTVYQAFVVEGIAAKSKSRSVTCQRWVV